MKTKTIALTLACVMQAGLPHADVGGETVMDEACGGLWLAGSPVAGANGVVMSSIRWDPDGVEGASDWVVICGEFHAVANTVARGVAAWDGSSWHQFGEGINGVVRAMTVWNGDLVVGGDFTEADGSPLDTIARWDGNTWQPIGTNLHGTTRALAVHNGDLVAAGRFAGNSGQFPLVMRWNGQTWAPMGEALQNNLVARDLAVVGETVFVCGTLHNLAFGIDGIARWDGSEWTGVGETSGSAIAELGVYKQELIAGGQIRSNWIELGGIARWDGLTWHSMGGGLSSKGGLPGAPSDMIELGADLLVVGFFDFAGGIPCHNIAIWNGEAWSPHSNGISYAPLCVVEFNDDLIVGGTFDQAGDVPVSYLARWDGSQWHSLSSGITSYIRATTVFQNKIFAGGSFEIAGPIAAGRLAEWDSIEWHPVEHAFDKDVWSLCTYEGRLIASGRVDNDFSSSIQAWNGTNWESLTAYMNSPARAMIQFEDDLIAIGDFGNINNMLIGAVARWDGSMWHQFGSGNIPIGGSLRAITVYNNQVVVGGGGSVPASHIAHWTGSEWQAVGSGVNNTVWALTTFKGELIAGGQFTTAGGVPVNYIARWNGNQWQSLGGGANALVNALGVHDGELFATGQFTEIGGVQANRVARWNGLKWSPLGSGIPSNQIDAFASLNGEMTMGGSFGVAGGMVASQFARWSSTGIPWIAIQPKSFNASCKTNAQFAVAVATGYDGLSYQWRRNGELLVDGPTTHGSLIQGATTSLLTISNSNSVDAGIYNVLIANECGEIESEHASLIIGTCGDTSGDNLVNVLDLLAILNGWGACAAPPAPCPADIAPAPYGDGVVNVLDLLMVIDNWG